MEQQRIETYINEYNLVTNKITSLSMKFANGSYVISISLVVGVASINISTDSLFKNGIFIILPIVILFYLYNHIRYMVLQFKLSGYARALEERINEISGDNILLWENSIARDNKQNSYEGFFCVIIYAGMFFLLFYGAYYNLAIIFYGSWNIWFILLLIVAGIYYSFIFFICSFIILFINEHERTYQKATSIYNKSPIFDKNNNITTSHVFVEEEQSDSLLKKSRNNNKSGKKSSKRPNKKPRKRSDKKPHKRSDKEPDKKLSKWSGKRLDIKRAIKRFINMCTLKIKRFKNMCTLKILLILLFFVSIPLSLLPLILFSKHSVNSAEKMYDYVVVLGNKSLGNEISEDMKCRLDCLLKYIDDSTKSMIIVSGGDGEADKMKKYLLNQGIPNDSIVVEEYSKNTRENLENTRSLVAGNVLVITSDYHVFRTKLLCNKLNLDWDMLPAKSESGIIFSALKECYNVFWELFGIGIFIFLLIILIISIVFIAYKCRDNQNSMQV